MEADAVTLWCYGITEWRINTREKQFLLTPIMRDGSEGPLADATEAYERFVREQR